MNLIAIPVPDEASCPDCLYEIGVTVDDDGHVRFAVLHDLSCPWLGARLSDRTR